MERITFLYELHRKPIFGYFLRMTGSKEEASELTQETFYQACLSLYRFKGEASLKTWLFSIARNVYLKFVREKGKRKEMIREGPFSENLPAPGSPDPSAEALILKEEHERIRKGLARIPEKDRTIIILKEFQGLSYEEVATVFDQTVNWARVNFFRAKKRLVNIYSEQEVDGI
ncbi:MAG: sigma-70 family RNA polymerase sigma factor [Firmicutes bacterium]|nr:sigma-70 family RNA polymerase sigma factor [Bacillota bacterium]MDD3851672.1 sigma-70 family RNA polymerase sigma factor [Bacillota bacterium]MDD4707026.1 sigma-70 family RNA polymerase sigma factor [Bacillota bacterium]